MRVRGGVTKQNRPAVPIRVLIVEDDDLVATSLERCCQSSDLVVVGIVSSGSTALRAQKKDRPDVVLLDQQLGPESGVDVAEELMAQQPSARVIMVTGVVTPELQAAAVLAGCSGCIEKTMNLAQALPTLIREAYIGPTN
jgi:DNA-binding NarL/FixJ family response regulator